MRSGKSKVSIGLPVFNGENYLEAAVDSILAQTFRDFELIISDNASTDRTQEICQRYCGRDSRVRYFRSEQNHGAAWNFNRVFELASGEYFKWAAHDDMIAPDFLQKCVAVLDEEPTVVLCHSQVQFINEYEEVTKNHHVKLNHISSSEPHDRFGDLIMLRHWCFDVFGLIRTDVLARTPLIAGYVASDRILLAELGLYGRFHIIPEYLFSSRDHLERSVRAIPAHLRTEWFDPTKKGQLGLPRWRTFWECFKLIWRVSLKPSQRLWCCFHMVKWLRYYRKHLVKDLLIAARYILHA